MKKRQPKKVPGEKVRYVREALHLTQEQLAAEFGFTSRHLITVEQTEARSIWRYALIGMCVTRGLPYGVLWPER